MPCSAPCNRLPCSKRCSCFLPCGHQCPSLCGEVCPSEYCQICCSDGIRDQRVDLLEFKSYAEISIEQNPIVVLSCGHFFTAETLDGHMGMAEVYIQDLEGEFSGLVENHGALARGVPQCPDCQQPIRQYVTQRYNRVINRAVIDEISKRVLISGETKIQEIEREIVQLEDDLKKSMKGFLSSTSRIFLAQRLKLRYNESYKLMGEVATFLQHIDDKNQPGRKLHDATVKAIRDSLTIDQKVETFSIQDNFVTFPRDRRVVFGGRAVQLKMLCAVFLDKINLYQELKSITTETSLEALESDLAENSDFFFESCQTFILDCNSEHLPKLNVEARLYFAQGARRYQSSSIQQTSREKATEHVATAREYLKEAEDLCVQRFQNADKLLTAVQETAKSLRKEWYEPVSEEELASIKNAMVSGAAGLMTHSGHWYNCERGHPVSFSHPQFPISDFSLLKKKRSSLLTFPPRQKFAVGECGMPMELARCPECGAPVGGLNHQSTAGVTRAEQME